MFRVFFSGENNFKKLISAVRIFVLARDKIVSHHAQLNFHHGGGDRRVFFLFFFFSF
jgi:hypothetical protein